MKKALLIGGVIILVYFIIELIKYPQHIKDVSQTGQFTEAFKEGFILRCKTDGASEDQCVCAIDYYESQYTYAEYLKIRNEETVINEMREKCE